MMHPQSYCQTMHRNLFDLLAVKFADTHIPPGWKIDSRRLDEAVSQGPTLPEGRGKGRAIRISPGCHRYLEEQKGVLDSYMCNIRDAGGIDWWVVGCGEKGHIAFHERGIPLEHEIMLVRLDENTTENAVRDGYFADASSAPKYALTMGAYGVVSNKRNVLLLASGIRKAEAVAESVLGYETADWPISILARNITYAERHTHYVLDEQAARKILDQERGLLRHAEKGILVADLR